MAARGIPGLSVTVAIDGKIIFSEGFGYADLEQRVPVWPTTKFRIGSVSKPLTAAALVKLVEQGRLDLDAPIQKYVPSFPDKGATITPRMLAGHLGGIRHYKDNEFLNSKHYDNVVAGLAIFQDESSGLPTRDEIQLLQLWIQFAQRRNRESLRRGFSFLHARSRFHSVGTALYSCRSALGTHRAARAVLHPLERQAARERPVHGQQLQVGRGRFCVQFGRSGAIRQCAPRTGLLAKGIAGAAVHLAETRSGEETGYGMGWFILKSKTGKRIFDHSGGSTGASSELILYPDEHLVIAMVCNYETNSNVWKFDEKQAIAEAFENK